MSRTYCLFSCFDWSIGPQNSSSSIFDFDRAVVVLLVICIGDAAIIWMEGTALDGDDTGTGQEESLTRPFWLYWTLEGFGTGI